MPRFIRNYVAGGTYFFTMVTSDRKPYFADTKCIDAFLSAFSTIQRYHHFELVAYCILPDHIHILMTLAEEDSNFSERLKEIKRKTTISLRKTLEKPGLVIWQKRFWEHTIWDHDEYQHIFDYIHYNPIKHGYSETYEWEWSSFWDYYGKDSFPDIDPKTFRGGRYSYGE
jgi:putative transposase